MSLYLQEIKFNFRNPKLKLWQSRSQKNAPVATDIYYITPNKCTECQGFHEEPQCAAVCPVDCCMPDEMYRETVEELMAKKEKLHI